VRSGAWLFGFLVLMLWSGPVWATITNPTATIINDQNGDGIAGIGDTIEFSCNSDNATAGQTPYVNLSPLGTARFILPQVVGTYYSAIFTVTQGSYDGVYTAPFVDNTSPVPCGNALTIDSQRPNSTTGAIVTAGNGPNGEYRIGDSLRVDIAMTTPFDSDTPSIDLTPIGLGGTNFFGGAWPNFSYTRTFPVNREGTGKVLTVSSTDNAGNRRTWNVSIDYDTKAPDVQTVQASINSGNAIARIGDVITVTATVAGYDTDTLIASSSQLWGGSVTMTKVGSPAPGAAATFQVQRAIPANLRVQDANAQVMITATDDVGNQTVAYSNYLSVDTIEPRFNNSPQALLIERRGILADNIGVIGDNLIIRGDLTAVMDDVTVTVDISGIGGVTNQLLYKAPGSTSFYLDFPINQYTSEDYTPRSFNVKGIDTAGNVKYEITLPVIYVDNQPPSLSGAQLAKVTTGNATAKIGDQIRLQVNVTNLDSGSIWADLRRIGGTGSDTFTPAGGSTYDLTFTVAAPAPTYGTLDGNLAFPIYCRDNAGNEASVVTNQLSFDNEPPVISAFSYSVNPPLGPGHTYVKVGDQITFNVTLANAGAQPHDTETVTMNLSSIGGLNNQVFNYDGAGNYSYTQVVQIGALNGPSANFVAIATDNAGNAVSQIFNVPIDNYPPAPGPMTVAPNRDNAKTGWMNVGVDDGAGNFTNPDRWEFAVPCTDPDNGVCTIDLSLVGGSPTATMNYDAALQRYYLLVDLAPATVRNTAYVFRATVKDKAGNTFNSVSGQQIVECVPPVINSVTSALSLDPNGNNIANVNDQITLTANVDRSRLNGGVPMVNVQSIGGLSAQQMYDDGAHGDNAPNDGVYGWIETVKKGNINGVLTSFAVSITDNAQNQVTRVTAPVRVANNPIVLTSFTGQQTVDTNNNGWVDLDGIYTTSSTWATDVVTFKLRVTGTPGTLGPVTLDLTPLGINDAAWTLPMTSYSSYWEGVASFSPLPGSTNRNTSVIFNAVINDVFGNVTNATTSAVLKIDNQAPTLTIYPVAFVQDTGIIGEANAGDIIRIKVRVNGHDDGGSPGILPQIDLTNLYLDNGLNPPVPSCSLPPAARTSTNMTGPFPPVSARSAA